MIEPRGHFTFSIINETPQQKTVAVEIGKEYLQALYKEALQLRKQKAKTFGFSQGSTPLSYIEQNFRADIVTHLKELLFTHCVMHYLYTSLHDNKIVIVGDPDLIEITVNPEENATFVFRLTHIEFSNDKLWQRLSMRPLRRKNYRDLDRQVVNFMETERKNKEESTSDELIIGDWVNFSISLLDTHQKDLLPGYANDVWVQIQGDEDDKDLYELFSGKKKGDQFLSNSVYLHEYLSPASDIHYAFLVEIKERLPGAYFSLNQFKHQFNLLEDHELPQKLIEVFSMRNDINLRRETIEALFKLLHKQYFLPLPAKLLDQQRRMVLQAVQSNPDYAVYKAQDDFKQYVKALAEKQLKEAIIIDAIGYQENITVNHDDICAYLNLLKRPRMKDFMYFVMPTSKTQGHEAPLPTALIKRYCLREKTLNYLINKITHNVKQ